MGISKNKRISKRQNPHKVKRSKRFEVAFGSGGEFEILGRSAFNSSAKAIKVNQTASKGALEDRRHILHYDEVLKPAIERVVGSLYVACGKDRSKVATKIRAALTRRGIKRLPKAEDKLFERLVTEINSAPGNLIPDRADTNKAIEVVRGYLRTYQKALTTDQFADDAYAGNTARMAEYKKRAKEIFVRDASTSDITLERNRIHGEILGFIDGCSSPAELWGTVHDMVHSVTFDFSPKTTRDATAKAIQWQRLMARNHGDLPEKQLDDLLGIIA
jgi:hypothetical protein